MADKCTSPVMNTSIGLTRQPMRYDEKALRP